ncbi:MAG TPA: biotin/lipoyl-containing protein, partial [Steroidobacteraceae bacterium]|nr:biotin/lipoyl-containing protein [Steroidobacteraceae bacterium]
MSVEIRVPQLPESVTDAKLMAWRKQAGESVSRDENLADLETDKVVLDVPAPINGVLREIKAQAGATVRSGELLAIIEEGAAPSAAPNPTPATAPGSGNGEADAPAGVPRTGPAARRVIEESKLASAAVAGSAPAGRITKADAEAAAAAKAAPAVETRPVSAPAPA